MFVIDALQVTPVRVTLQERKAKLAQQADQPDPLLQVNGLPASPVLLLIPTCECRLTMAHSILHIEVVLGANGAVGPTLHSDLQCSALKLTVDLGILTLSSVVHLSLHAARHKCHTCR